MCRRSPIACGAASSRSSATPVGASTTAICARTASRRASGATARSSISFFGRASRTAGCPFAGRASLPRNVLLRTTPRLTLVHSFAGHIVRRETSPLCVVRLVYLVLSAHSVLPGVNGDCGGHGFTRRHGGTETHGVVALPRDVPSRSARR